MHELPLQPDHVAEQPLGQAVLAHHGHGAGAAVVGELEVPVARHDHEPVALHPGHGLADGGAALREPFRDPRAQGDDALFFEFVDGPEVHLGGVDELVHARSPFLKAPVYPPVAARKACQCVQDCRVTPASPLMSAERLAELPEAELVILDVRWRLGGPPGRADYDAAHIPGAVFVDLDTELADPPGPGGRHPLPDPARLQAVLRACRRARRHVGGRLRRRQRRCRGAGLVAAAVGGHAR